MEGAGRAPGAVAALPHRAGVAQLMADPPVFIRQDHAERDEASLAEFVIEEEGISWQV